MISSELELILLIRISIKFFFLNLMN